MLNTLLPCSECDLIVQVLRAPAAENCADPHADAVMSPNPVSSPGGGSEAEVAESAVADDAIIVETTPIETTNIELENELTRGSPEPSQKAGMLFLSPLDN